MNDFLVKITLVMKVKVEIQMTDVVAVVVIKSLLLLFVAYPFFVAQDVSAWIHQYVVMALVVVVDHVDNLLQHDVHVETSYEYLSSYN